MAGRVESVPGKAAANGAGVSATVGSTSTVTPCCDSRSAPARAIASTMITSVESGRWGPWASVAPSGTTATARRRSSAATSS